MSYYYTALAISIPESFDWGARPVVSRSEDWAVDAWSNMDNSDGTIPPPSSLTALPDQNSAGTEEWGYASSQAPPSMPDTTFTTIGDITFPSTPDTAHPETENCFTFLPSISVQGSPSEKCDCGTTTAALTTQGSSTGCALSNTIFAINQFPVNTGIVTSSATPAPVVTPSQPTPTRAFEIMFKHGLVDGIQLDAWTVYSHAIGQATKIDACNGGFWEDSAGDTVSFPSSLGVFTDAPYSGCRYEGPTTAPGSVSCPDMASWTTCSAATSSTQACDNGAGEDTFIAQAECEF